MNSKGFTLLEALVTLVIVAMVATLLMQSLFQVLGLRERVLLNDRETRIAALQEAWFRDSVSGLIAELPGREGAFLGDADGWSALTLAGISSDGQIPVAWRIAGVPAQAFLEIAEAGEQPVAVRTLSPAARFQYLDGAGVWRDMWPVGDRSDELLPRVIRLQDPDGRPAWIWQAPVAAGPGLPQPVRALLEPGIDANRF